MSIAERLRVDALERQVAEQKFLIDKYSDLVARLTSTVADLSVKYGEILERLPRKKANG
jgi:uncharacterized coiled-coil protein SlyX